MEYMLFKLYVKLTVLMNLPTYWLNVYMAFGCRVINQVELEKLYKTNASLHSPEAVARACCYSPQMLIIVEAIDKHYNTEFIEFYVAINEMMSCEKTYDTYGKVILSDSDVRGLLRLYMLNGYLKQTDAANLLSTNRRLWHAVNDRLAEEGHEPLDSDVYTGVTC